MLIKPFFAPIVFVVCNRQHHFTDSDIRMKQLDVPGRALNRVSHELYGKALEYIKESGVIYPLLISQGSKLTLIDNRPSKHIRLVTQFNIPAKFTVLKQVSHAALGLVSILSNFVHQDIPEQFIEPLNELEASLTQIKNSFTTHYNVTLTERELYKNTKFIDSTLDFMRSILSRKFVDDILYFSYARNVEPTLRENIILSAAAYVERLHQEFKSLVNNSHQSEDYWKEVKIVIIANHFTKNRNLSLQYFQSALNDLQLCDRIFESDSSNEEDVIQLVAKHYLELDKIGKDLFSDSGFLHTDILADGTGLYLKKLKAIGELPIRF